MIHRYVACTVVALMVGCGGLTEHDDSKTRAVQSALNPDPGATSLSFHSPSGMNVEIRSVTPMGQADPIYMKYDGVEGEVDDGKGGNALITSTAFFEGDIVGGDAVHTTAAIAPLAAILVGLASPDQFSQLTGLVLKPVKLQSSDKPIDQMAFNFVKQAFTYVNMKGGPAAGAIASQWLGGLGIDPCLDSAPVPKEL
jgi:hypothetical protein